MVNVTKAWLARSALACMHLNFAYPEDVTQSLRHQSRTVCCALCSGHGKHKIGLEEDRRASLLA
jgi:hypothetical protein